MPARRASSPTCAAGCTRPPLVGTWVSAINLTRSSSSPCTAAFAHTAWSARAREHPKIARAMATGILSESWARALCEITGKIPQPGRDDADALPVWTKLHGGTLDDLVALATEMYLRSLPGGPRTRRPPTGRCGWPPPWTAPGSCRHPLPSLPRRTATTRSAPRSISASILRAIT